MAAADIDELLGRQYGAFNGWTWGAILASGIGIAAVLRSRLDPTAGDDDQVPPDELVDPITGLAYAANPVGGPVPAVDRSAPIDIGDDPDDPGQDGSDAVTEWINAAVDALRGEFGAGDSWNALRRAASGAQLSTSEIEIFEAAVERVGPPPANFPYVVPSAPVEPSPDAPAPLEPRQGYGAVTDNLGITFVVHWATERRWRVPPHLRDELQSIFGPPLTNQDQLPIAIRQQQHNWEKSKGIDSNAIYLDGEMGWREVGAWTVTRGTKAA